MLGWGGYWGWDSREVAALLPWISDRLSPLHHDAGEALSFQTLNMILMILTYSLVIFGTFLTRSGVFSSVHAFSQSAIGPLFFGFIAMTLLISLVLLALRWRNFGADAQLQSPFSREGLFLMNNLVMMGLLIACLWGVIYPLISEIFTGQQVTMGPGYYESVAGPLFALLLLLKGIAPLTTWGAGSSRSLGKRLLWPALGSVWLDCLTALWRPPVYFFIGLALLLGDHRHCIGHNQACSRPTPERSPPARILAADQPQPPPLWEFIIHLGVALMAVGIGGIELYQLRRKPAERAERLAGGLYRNPPINFLLGFKRWA